MAFIDIKEYATERYDHLVDQRAEAPKVSVVVPMYNCEGFLHHFFEMMQNQTWQDYELICVIDGATDNTLNLVKTYAETDQRIKWIYKENGGAGSARNVGLDQACGEYIMWIDADDLYKEDLLKEMIRAADEHDADMVLCLIEQHDFSTGAIREGLGFNRTAFPENKCVDPGKVDNLFQKVGSGPTNKLYRRSFVVENQLHYSETQVANDIFFIFSASAAAKRVVGVHKSLIITQRFANAASITSNRGKHTDDMLVAVSQLYEWLEKRNMHERYHDTYCRVFANSLGYNASFGTNPKLIEGAAYMLNEKEPWVSMEPSEVFRYLNGSFHLRRLNHEIRALKKEINGKSDDSKQNLLMQVQRKENRYAVYAIIEIMSSVKYGRVFRNGPFLYTPMEQLIRKPLIQDELLKQKETLAAIKKTKEYRIVNRMIKLKNGIGFKKHKESQLT